MLEDNNYLVQSENANFCILIHIFTANLATGKCVLGTFLPEGHRHQTAMS